MHCAASSDSSSACAMACRRLVRACANSSAMGLLSKRTCGSHPPATSPKLFSCETRRDSSQAASRLFASKLGAGSGLSLRGSKVDRFCFSGSRGGWLSSGQRIALDRSMAMASTVSNHGENASPQAVTEVEADAVVKPRRFAVLTTGRAADYCLDNYGGYGPMFITMLSDPGETWDEYFVVDGQFPSSEELQKYDGFVVTGSRHDAHGDEEWIEKLCGVLQRIHEMKKKSLCVCFGHQVVSRALGGKTGRAAVGWEVGLRDLCLTDSFFSKPYGAGMPPRLKVLEVHRDQVSDLPPGAELLASSERTGVEMFAVGEHVLAIQGHPEFFEDVVVDLLEGRLAPMMTVGLTPSYFRFGDVFYHRWHAKEHFLSPYICSVHGYAVQKEEIMLAKESLQKARADQEAWQQLCKEFLKGKKR